MKMGTIASPWRYDTAILRCALLAAVFPISRMVRYPSIAAFSIHPGNGVMSHKETPLTRSRRSTSDCSNRDQERETVLARPADSRHRSQPGGERVDARLLGMIGDVNDVKTISR